VFSEHQESKPENNTAKTGNQVAADEGSDSDAGLPLIAAMFQLPQPPTPQNQSGQKPRNWREDIKLGLKSWALLLSSYSHRGVTEKRRRLS
jgi:hypothetical protein